MKLTLLLVPLVVACTFDEHAANEHTLDEYAITESNSLCALNEDGTWIGDCGSIPGGGGGDPGDGSCHTTPCTYDLECKVLCWTPQATCQWITVGPYTWSGCVDW